MKKIPLGKTGEKISVLGQGTWGIRFLKSKNYYERWKESLRKGIELGMNHIDTAEIYGAGTSERVVGELVSEYKRDDLFITTKLFPRHLSINSSIRAASKSLKRLCLNHVDLYLIHWPSPIFSIRKQMKAIEQVLNEGKTRYIGVSNFSVEQFKEAQSFLKKAELVNNQLHANLIKQQHITESLPYYQEAGITITAYSPLGHRGLTKLSRELKDKLDKVANNHNATIQQIAIAWLLNHENIITIPKAYQINHIEANAQAAEIKLAKEELDLLTQN